MAWIILVLAGFFEVGFTTCMKLANNFTNWKWSLGFFICIACSFFLLNKATQTIPLGMAYAVWSGIGAVGTVLVGILFFKEDANFWKIFFICTLIASIIGLKLLGGKA
ncbi:DMT family transporter [Gynurincola endophyticus]|jgi:quaternary ammonium compound-resistance protein SugE|uniref:DMT family transporter n=1 Tax=Gynurincola endophyticus TaxID=2479004 RepID=UPI000F8EA6CA|nr:multidrug efflux SMR transporter [Gynurincola endophyticus]